MRRGRAGNERRTPLHFIRAHLCCICGNSLFAFPSVPPCLGGAFRRRRPWPPFPTGARYDLGMSRAIIAAIVVLVTCSMNPAADPKVLFEDPLKRKLGEGWSWLREDAGGHRVTDAGLEIRIQPGDANTVKNALVRAAPDRSKGRYAVEVTVTSLAKPVNQWEQAGITWYVDGKPAFKLVKELVDGKIVVWPGGAPDPGESVRLRVVVSADAFTAQYRPVGADGKPVGDWRTAATGKLPPPKDDQVSLQCYHGPRDAEHWARFSDFRIVEAAE